MVRSLLDTNIIIDHLNGVAEAQEEIRRHDGPAISIITWMEVLVGAGDLEAETREALEAFPDLRFNLDVKAAAAALPLGRVVAPHADRVLLTSFSDRRRRESLDAARTAGGFPATSAGQATVARALVASRLGRAMLSRALAGIDALQVPERVGVLRVVTRRFVRAVHAVGVEVHVWTVNDADAMRRLLDLGVDGLVTDRADVAIAVASGRPH